MSNLTKKVKHFRNTLWHFTEKEKLDTFTELKENFETTWVVFQDFS